jgi:hypothetical protein
MRSVIPENTCAEIDPVTPSQQKGHRVVRPLGSWPQPQVPLHLCGSGDYIADVLNLVVRRLILATALPARLKDLDAPHGPDSIVANPLRDPSDILRGVANDAGLRSLVSMGLAELTIARTSSIEWASPSSSPSAPPRRAYGPPYKPRHRRSSYPSSRA